MDILDDILDTLNLRGALYFRADFRAPWGVTVPELAQAARFHLLVSGSCHVRFESGASVELGPGDLVLVPRGRTHVLADVPCRRAPPLESVLADSRYDGRGCLVVPGDAASAPTRMLCGHLSFREGADHPLLKALPEYLLLPASERAEQPWLDELLTLATRHVFTHDARSAATLKRLSEIIFMELLRHGIHNSGDLRLALSAFRDRHVSKALELIHRMPQQSWTVESLARRVGMSRSRFAQRFKDLMGMGPMAYLSDWRLQKALNLLHDERSSIQQVASQIGYESPAAFTRAFCGKFGVPPTQYRRMHG